MWFLKITGLLLLLCVCTSTGFLAARRLKTREEGLRRAGLCLNALKERIRLDGGELPRLVCESFSDAPFVETRHDTIIVTGEGLDAGDTALLREYFDSAGMSDIEAECDRAALYITLLAGRHAAAAKRADELCRIYRSAGFLCGVFLCIFLL